MTRDERRQLERIDRAIRWVQGKLEQRFEWVYQINRRVEVFQISRSGRGIEDPQCFILEWNPDTIEATTLKELRSDCLHEVLHAMSWQLWEELMRGKTAAEITHLRRTVYEPMIYELERRFRPYLIG